MWFDANAKEKVKITKIDSDARERAREEDKARVREKNNALQRAAEESSVNIRAKAEAKRAKREG